jgi:hypothetical protein
MASTWRYTVTLIDEKALKTTLNFIYEADNVDLGSEFDDAEAAAAALLTDLEAVTDANVYSEVLGYLRGGDPTLPNDADITDEAAVVCFLTADDVLPEYHTLRIPAPIDAMFESDGKTVDEDNAALIAYVANFADGEFTVSDGQYIVTANDNGISHGFWRSRAKSSR